MLSPDITFTSLPFKPFFQETCPDRHWVFHQQDLGNQTIIDRSIDRYIQLSTSVPRNTFSAKGKININMEIIQFRVKFTISSLRIEEGRFRNVIEMG